MCNPLQVTAQERKSTSFGGFQIRNRFSYLRTLVTDDLKVTLRDLDITGSITPDAGGGSVVKPGSGGSSSSGGPTEGEGGDA